MCDLSPGDIEVVSNFSSKNETFKDVLEPLDRLVKKFYEVLHPRIRVYFSTARRCTSCTNEQGPYKENELPQTELVLRGSDGVGGSAHGRAADAKMLPWSRFA